MTLNYKGDVQDIKIVLLFRENEDSFAIFRRFLPESCLPPPPSLKCFNQIFSVVAQ